MVTSRFTLGAALVVLIQLIVTTSAAAQALREGPSFTYGWRLGHGTVPGYRVRPRHGGLPDGLRPPDPTAGSSPRTAWRWAASSTCRPSAVAQPDRARRLQTRSGRVPGRLVQAPGVNPNAYQVWGRLVRVRTERRAALHRPRLFHRGASRRR